jgi:hypothetical protein
MIPLLLLIIGIFLLIFSIIDWKVKMIPSIFLTAILFVIAFLYPANLWFGLMGFIMAYLLYEADFFSGIADVKVMAMIGLMISTTTWMLIFIGLVVILGLFWKILIKWRMKKEKETAFIPIFLFIYIAMILLGGII